MRALCPPMRRKLGSVLSIEDLAILAKVADQLKFTLERELARRAAKGKLSWDDIASAMYCLGSEWDIALMLSCTSPSHMLPRQIITVKSMAAMVMEQIRQRSK